MTLTWAPRPPAGGQRCLLCLAFRYRRPPALCYVPSRPPAPPLGVRSPPARLRVPARGSLVRSPWRQEEGRGPAAPSPARLAGDQRAGGTRRRRSCGPDCSSGPPALCSCCSGSWPAATPGGSRPGTLQPRGKRPAPFPCPAAAALPARSGEARRGARSHWQPRTRAPHWGSVRARAQPGGPSRQRDSSVRLCTVAGSAPFSGGAALPGRVPRGTAIQAVSEPVSVPWSGDLGRGEPGTCHLVSRLAGFPGERASGCALAGPGPLRRRPVRGRGLFPCLGYARPVDLGPAGVSGDVSASARARPTPTEGGAGAFVPLLFPD